MVAQISELVSKPALVFRSGRPSACVSALLTVDSYAHMCQAGRSHTPYITYAYTYIHTHMHTYIQNPLEIPKDILAGVGRLLAACAAKDFFRKTRSQQSAQPCVKHSTGQVTQQNALV